MNNIFDPTKEENWHFHDEYEFWYIEFPEIIKPDPQCKIDLARERGFKPWERAKEYLPADLNNGVRERVIADLEYIIKADLSGLHDVQGRARDCLALLVGDE